MEITNDDELDLQQFLILAAADHKETYNETTASSQNPFFLSHGNDILSGTSVNGSCCEVPRSSSCADYMQPNDDKGCVKTMEIRKDLGFKIAFRTKSNLEVMDDGYKWRKYGKKKVKNSPNPRNYYRCSTGGCKVKKRVEREREDPRFVITTYVGKHNHESLSPVPAPATCHTNNAFNIPDVHSLTYKILQEP